VLPQVFFASSCRNRHFGMGGSWFNFLGDGGDV